MERALVWREALHGRSFPLVGGAFSRSGGGVKSAKHREAACSLRLSERRLSHFASGKGREKRLCHCLSGVVLFTQVAEHFFAFDAPLQPLAGVAQAIPSFSEIAGALAAFMCVDLRHEKFECLCIGGIISGDSLRL